MVICKRNYEETCDCGFCLAEKERRRIASEGVTSVKEEERHG